MEKALPFISLFSFCVHNLMQSAFLSNLQTHSVYLPTQTKALDESLFHLPSPIPYNLELEAMTGVLGNGS